MADATLTALFPAIPLRVGGEQVSVRPVVFRELPLVQRVMQGWIDLVGAKGVGIPPEAFQAFLELLAGATGKPLDWVKALPEDEFENLACFALAINREIWDPERKQEDDQETLTWASITQRLVANGHPWESIQNLTLSQMRAFLNEALRLEREQFALDITAASFAMADGKSVQSATKELRRG